jgi:uncharacterized glyoxalase superfamily protein PhnB/uncharacterized protein YndB with AHSA1/START domain
MNVKQSNQVASLVMSHEFDAPKELVFKAFGDATALSEWWGPIDSTNTVLRLDFRPGGIFLYRMVRDGKTNFGRFVFNKIEQNELLEFTIAFSDEQGKPIKAPFDIPLPLEIFYRLRFTEEAGRTTIVLKAYPVDASTEEESALRSIKTNMQEGFAATFNQLARYLQAQFKLRSQLKRDTMARTTTYLNFPGNTEEAFNYYKSVFGTSFTGNGIQRLGDIPPEAGQPPLSEELKKMVLHVELPITGGHVLMATDAPKEMGFTLTTGNNMHICVEPETRAETKKLFDSLSNGGNITMPLADMFWGAYFGSLTDKFGINWMVNCIEKQ